MRLFMTICLAILAGTALFDSFEAVKITAGQTLFDAECQRFHEVGSQAFYEPPMENVVYRGEGSAADYNYCVALEASGIVWTPIGLLALIEVKDGFMLGIKMRHVGIEDRTAQDSILAYLTSISD